MAKLVCALLVITGFIVLAFCVASIASFAAGFLELALR